VSKSGKGFFQSGSLKLNREIKQDRAQAGKEADKGFCGQIRRVDKSRHTQKAADAKHFHEEQYTGQDTVLRQGEIKAPEKGLDPSQIEEGDGNTGFSDALNWNHANPRRG